METSKGGKRVIQISTEFDEDGGEEDEDAVIGGDDKKKGALNPNPCKRRSSGSGSSSPHRSCQVEGCNADMTDAKAYHRRHRVCEYHAKAAVVVVGGVSQRFCQQCSRFHELSEFDEAKRSCRRRLAGHNERRRKSSSYGSQ